MHIPKKMLLVDVAPRDGLQSLPKWIDTDTKVWFSNRLTALGVPVIEVASFAHPKVVPNMRDAEEVFARIRRKPGVVYRGQAPNVRGAHRAIEAALTAGTVPMELGGKAGCAEMTRATIAALPDAGRRVA